MRLEKLRKCRQCNIYFMTTIDFESHQKWHLKNDLDFHETEQDFEIRSENVQQHQHETIDAKLENEEITSNTFGKDLSSGKNSTALKKGSQNNKDTFKNVSKAFKSDNEHVDVEGNVIKTEFRFFPIAGILKGIFDSG